jgi:hypothetical protein
MRRCTLRICEAVHITYMRGGAHYVYARRCTLHICEAVHITYTQGGAHYVYARWCALPICKAVHIMYMPGEQIIFMISAGQESHIAVI